MVQIDLQHYKRVKLFCILWQCACVSVCVCVCVCAVSNDVNYGALWAQTGNKRKAVLLSTIYQHMNQNNRWIVVRAIWESARVLCNQWTQIIRVKVCHSLHLWVCLLVSYFVIFFSPSSVCLFMSLFPLPYSLRLSICVAFILRFGRKHLIVQITNKHTLPFHQKFGVTCYIDVSFLSFNNGYFNRDKNSVIQALKVLSTFETVLAAKQEELND